VIQRLANIQLTTRTDIFRWNLYENGKFSVAFIYNALILPDAPVYDNKKIWKIKIPLKNKVFAWYLHRGVILTKDNLIKRNWHGSQTCIFCSQDETIKHLFFQCNLARSIWSVIPAASGLYTPTSIANLFGNWLHGIDYKYRILLRVGAMALIWSLWLCRNDKVFNDKNYTLLQVIYWCTGTLRIWSQLHRLEDELVGPTCKPLSSVYLFLLSESPRSDSTASISSHASPPSTSAPFVSFVPPTRLPRRLCLRRGRQRRPPLARPPPTRSTRMDRATRDPSSAGTGCGARDD
jgi:hypothetical protein